MKPDLNLILDYIYADNYDKKIIYFAIGSAHHMARIMNNQLIIDEQYDQQYPMFLREINKNHADYKTYIILIDPLLEEPSFTVKNKFINNIDILEDGWVQDNNYFNIYLNNTKNIVLFEYREYIKYSHEEYSYNPDEILFEPILGQLNNLAMAYKWFVILMDYTGRPIYDLAYKYDYTLGKDKDHIFYGLPHRKDGGCYIDLSDENNYYITDTDCGYLRAFTTYNYEPKELIDLYESIKLCEDKRNKVIKYTINEYYVRIISNFKNHVLNIYRRILINDTSTIIFNMQEFNYLFKLYFDRFNFLDISDERNFLNSIAEHNTKLIEIMTEILDIEFNKLCNYLKINDDIISKYYANKLIKEPYCMYSEMCKMLAEIIM